MEFRNSGASSKVCRWVGLFGAEPYDGVIAPRTSDYLGSRARLVMVTQTKTMPPGHRSDLIRNLRCSFTT
jgi:hypothetical protein